MAEGNTWLQLQMRNGCRIAYIVPGKMRIAFNDEQMLLTSDYLTATLNRNTVVRYSFFDEGNITSSIDEATINDVKVTYLSRDMVEISGIASNQRIRVYASNGTEQQPHIALSGDKARIDLSALGSGVFIITLPDSDIPSVKVIH